MEVANKLFIPPNVMEYFRKTGAMGGSAKSQKKTESCKRNGNAPCHPGKRRGRPKGAKNKKK